MVSGITAGGTAWVEAQVETGIGTAVAQGEAAHRAVTLGGVPLLGGVS